MRMRTIALFVLIAACAGCAAGRGHLLATPGVLSLIPLPAHIERGRDSFVLRDGASLVVDGDNVQTLRIARQFADLLTRTRGLHLNVRSIDGHDVRDAIIFSLGDFASGKEGPEAYELTVDSYQIRVGARAPRGLFYGVATLLQLLTQEEDKTASISVPVLHITDAPRFTWRGAMLDSARHFQSPDFIKHFIDQLALLKLNVFHWHLTDDQGWRIEIKKYPHLTEVGAWRRPAGAAGTEVNGKSVRYGGYYTQDEIRDIVRYAAERQITIVPEIDMPGHMQAAIAAYPALGSAGDTPVVSPDWGVHSYILNIDETTFTFVENVLDEVMALFPGTYVHVGGDEAVKDQWKASPRVQARMRELGIANEDALQGWFIARLQKYLAAHGRKLIGWDEILEGGLPSDATVMSWRGVTGGIEAARQGHDVVMAPSPDLYLDHLQSDAADEPSGRPDLRTLADIYAFQPTSAAMDAQTSAHVLGAQANLWTEHMRTTAMIEHAAFPRLAALAETLWSSPSKRNWPDFVDRLVPQMARWRALGVNAADSAFEVRFADDDVSVNQDIRVTLSNQVALPIRYTLDGSAPEANSPLYRESLQLSLPSTVHAATFLDGRRVGTMQSRQYTQETLRHRTGDALKQCSGRLTLRLEDDAPAEGARAFFNVDLFDPCWIWPGAKLDNVASIAVTLGQLPYNFQLGKDIAGIVPRPMPENSQGELRVIMDGCAGTTIARLQLASAFANPALTTLQAALSPQNGLHDLCFVFAERGHDPLWAIDAAQLAPAPH